MKLLYICEFQFLLINEKKYSLSAYPNEFWEKYLDVFDSIHVVGITREKNINRMVELTDERITVSILPSNNKPKDYKYDFMIKKNLREYINSYDAILIKPASRKGMMAIKIAKKLNKPYMIEMTGDIESSLSTHNSILRRIYAPFLFHKTLKVIKDCKFGLYVTEKFLEKKYPISGLQCGCTDTDLKFVDDNVLINRIKKIENNNGEYKVGLIGTYHDNRKGIDVAIRALSKINDKNTSLHILGGGQEKDRNKWYKYSKKYNFDLLFFDGVLNNKNDVFKWIDNCDLIILPSRSEGLPRCIVESMSRGCPCVASNVCGIPELINENLLHNPNDFEKLSELIILLKNNKSLQINTAKENFEKSKKYTYEAQKIIRNKFLLEFFNYCKQKKGV